MKAILAQVVTETPTVSTFKLQANQLWPWAAGQWMYVTITQKLQTLKHHFTISSSPTEPFLQFTTMFRPESEYKQALFKLKVGDEVDVNGPFGSFVLDPGDPRPQLFLAGGIGITPFRSILKYVVDKHLQIPIVLLYSVKTRSDGAFAQELQDSKTPNIQIIFIETKEEGRLNEEKVRKLVPDFASRTWWVCGPPAMVVSLVDLASHLGVGPDRLKSEEFTGY